VKAPLKAGKTKQSFDRCRGEGRVLLDRQGRQAVARLGTDHDASAAARDNLAEFLQEKCGSVKVDF
jgi:hypothetical protein